MATSAKRAPELKRPELFRQQSLIGGQWGGSRSGETFDVFDPATGELIGTAPEHGPEGIKEAAEVAAKAFDKFRATSNRARSDMLKSWAAKLRENQDDLAKIVTWENGKPLAEAKGEILLSALNFEWFAEEAPRIYGETIPSANVNARMHTIKQPIGVCGIITPWNFPASMISRKIGAVVAAGCTGVIKPASETPYSALAMAYLAEEAGIPAGVVNVITAHKHTKEVGLEMCENKTIKKITFTGSTNVGKILMKQSASTLKKVSFELGGNAPFIVFDDANIDKAVEGAAASKFRGSGQTCICANRFFVHEKIYDEFAKKFAEKVAGLKPGHGLDEGTTQGPLINQNSIDKVTRHVEDAIAKKGRVLVGGKPLPDLGPNFYAPTVIADGTTDMAVFQEETFGPLAVMTKFGSDEELIKKANDVDVGLAAYMFTESVNRIHTISEALDVGMVGINTGLITEAALPFGGVKESGFGRETSKYGLDDYLVIKTVVQYL